MTFLMLEHLGHFVNCNVLSEIMIQSCSRWPATCHKLMMIYFVYKCYLIVGGDMRFKHATNIASCWLLASSWLLMTGPQLMLARIPGPRVHGLGPCCCSWQLLKCLEDDGCGTQSMYLMDLHNIMEICSLFSLRHYLDLNICVIM